MVSFWFHFPWVYFFAYVDFINLFTCKSNRGLDITNPFLLFVYDSNSTEQVDAFLVGR